MYRPYRTPIVTASPNLKIPEPRISKFVVFLARLLSRLYLFLFFGVFKVVLEGERELFDAFKRALAGESRCIIAFRHPNGGEPQILSWFFLYKLRALAAKKGVRFARRPHAVFVYTFEVVRWGGWPARFIMPRIGAMPIHHAKIDSLGMGRIYRAITEGPYPLALAPEGQVSYTTDGVPRIEPGAIRIGFQAAERLAAKEKLCPVEILPVSVYFRFGPIGRGNLELLLKKVEKYTGLANREQRKLGVVERIRRCRDYILEVNEERYRIKGDPSLSFEERLDKVIDAALETAERMLGMKNDGALSARMYRVRQCCWDRIFLPDFDSFKGMSRVKRSTLDIQAGEAWHIGRHQEIVDFCWYFRVPLPTEETALHSKIEYIQNLWDFANRTMGGAYPERKSVFARKVIIHASPVISLSDRLPAYRKDKKATVAATLTDLERAYLDSITKINSGDRG